jgi:polyhydroxybutyrate depolymerase
VYLACALLCASGAQAAHRERLEIRSGGDIREYILVTPDSAPQGRRPLVLLLHGHLGTAANALGAGIAPSPLSAWLDIVDRESVLVAALQGRRGSDDRTGWHDCRADNTRNPAVDDVGFAAAVVHDLAAAGRVDAQRIYVMGMSNGAIMSFRLALEMQPAPAAIAAVAGTMAARSGCSEARKPVSVLIIHGTDDPLVPYGGGQVAGGPPEQTGSVTGVAATRDYWLKVDGLPSTVTDSFTFAHEGGGATRASKALYGSARGPQVEVLTIEGGGHVEPSLRYHYGPLYARIVGRQSRDLESAEEAWAFFRDKSSR